MTLLEEGIYTLSMSKTRFRIVPRKVWAATAPKHWSLEFIYQHQV